MYDDGNNDDEEHDTSATHYYAYNRHDHDQHAQHRRNTLPPKFIRRPTIRDPVDLAYSIEEFVRNLNNK